MEGKGRERERKGEGEEEGGGGREEEREGGRGIERKRERVRGGGGGGGGRRGEREREWEREERGKGIERGRNRIIKLISANLIAIGVTTNHDGLLPSCNESRNVLTNDGLSEDSSSQDVTNGTVGALPHLLQLELCSTARYITQGHGLGARAFQI